MSEAVAELPVLATADEVLKLLRTTRRNLYRMIAAGKLTSVKHGHGGSSRLLFPRHDLERYLRSLTVAA